MFSSLFSRNRDDLERKNYSRLSIISDFHYPCKKLVTPKERLRYMAAKEGALQDMNDWRDLDLAVFTGRYGPAQRQCRRIPPGAARRQRPEKAESFIAGNHELLYTGHGEDLRPCSSTERILHFARYTKTFGPLYYAKEQRG